MPVKALSNEPQYVEDSQEKVLKSNIAILEEAKLNILQAQQKQKEHYDKKHANPHSYSIGTKVLLKDFKRKKTKGGKLLIRWKGPYTIVKLLGRGTYMLSDANSNTVQSIASHIMPSFQIPKQKILSISNIKENKVQFFQKIFVPLDHFFLK